MERRFTTNSRVIQDIFAQYSDTFLCLCELINNSIQADAKNISLDIKYVDPKKVSEKVIDEITIKDDGHGVWISKLATKSFNIGCQEKENGKGIGRFSALQIGEKVTIETIGYDNNSKEYNYIKIPLDSKDFSVPDIAKVKVITDETVLKGSKHNTYYQVSIAELYSKEIVEKFPKRKISEKFIQKNILSSIFERYPELIFNKHIKFTVNKEYLDPNSFIEEKPIKVKGKFEDKQGKKHNILISYYKLKTQAKDIKVFLTVNNSGVETVAAQFDFDADWLTPDIGTWFVYINSSYFSTDLLRNLDLTYDENIKHLKEFIKLSLTEFFKEKSKEYQTFRDKLKADKDYKTIKQKSSSETKTILFENIAYILEAKHHLLYRNHELKPIIYPLIDKALSSGHFKDTLKNILKIDEHYLEKLNKLEDKTRLEDVIDFSEKVASKQQHLDFLEKICYSEISKYVQERSELHKYLESMLWIFGEQYLESTKVLSDTNLEKNLKQLRDKHLPFVPDTETDQDGNINEIEDKEVRSITDLFLFSEKIIDSDSREILIVELKAPKVKLSTKELAQVKKYAFQIEASDYFSEKIKYKIILVGTSFTKQTTSELKGTSKNKPNNPYYYWSNDSENIEIQVIKWSDIIEASKRRLSYLSNKLKVKDKSVKKSLETEFADIESTKLKSSLKKSKSTI